MNSDQPESNNLPFDHLGEAEAASPVDPNEPMKILLAEEPEARTPASWVPEPLPDDTPLPISSGLEELPGRPSRLAPIKAMVKEVYFDPTKAFASEVDWSRFRKAQITLFFLSLAMPFIMLLLTGVLLGIVYLTGTSLYSVTSPNPTYQLMLYPLVFVLARGYWMAYLALPLGLFAAGWLWAAPTAWVLSRSENEPHIDFRKALSILAMLGAMLAPFTMFPFLRLLALAVILWFVLRRLDDTYEIGFWRLVGRGGLILVAVLFLYGAFERKVESYFPATEELSVNLNAFFRQHKMLEWPSFQTKIYINPNERLYADLSNFNAQIREQAVQKALNLLKAGSDTPEFRYRLAHRLADDGYTDAFFFLSRFAAMGQGTAVDPAAALEWMQKFSDANPKNLGAHFERVRLLIQNSRKLEGKRHLVEITKNQIDLIYKVVEFIQAEGLGRSDGNFTQGVQNLYQYGNTTSYVGSYNRDPGSSRYEYETQTKQEALLKDLYLNEHDQTLWFYRAMAAEYNRGPHAGPETYGEPPPNFAQADLDRMIAEGDPVAMDIAADRIAHAGDVDKARQYWLAATRVLDSDNRYANVAYYLKLAESYDPEYATKAADPREASKYYLAALLISTWQGRETPVGRTALQRLQAGKIPDAMSQPFLDLCLKSDIPEAWAMMGDRYINGDFPGVAKNAVKGRECFLKAQALGYKSPQFQKQLALLVASAPTGK